jgi:hypothetical protein
MLALGTDNGGTLESRQLAVTDPANWQRMSWQFDQSYGPTGYTVANWW